MKKHVMALTYAPKIEPVKSGKCRQTIRKGCKFAAGDEILIHGWAGRPYRSKWSWRQRVVVKSVETIIVSTRGVTFIDADVRYDCAWADTPVTMLASINHIDPPTGEALRDVLFGLNGAPGTAEDYQIVRWSLRHNRNREK